jgi:cysteine desulfurase
VDLLSLSGHKFYGPKGVGLLYVRKGTKLRGQALGSQEGKKRGGTENVPAIVAMSLALEEAEKKREKEVKRLTELRDYFIKEVLKRIPDARLNGDAKKRLPGLAHFSFAGVEGEALLLRLDEAGVMVSTASACSSANLQPSHVLEAIKLDRVVAHGSVRFSFGRFTTKAEINYILRALVKVVADLREMSPIYKAGMLKEFKA